MCYRLAFGVASIFLVCGLAFAEEPQGFMTLESLNTLQEAAKPKDFAPFVKLIKEQFGQDFDASNDTERVNAVLFAVAKLRDIRVELDILNSSLMKQASQPDVDLAHLKPKLDEFRKRIDSLRPLCNIAVVLRPIVVKYRDLLAGSGVTASDMLLAIESMIPRKIDAGWRRGVKNM